MQQSAIDQEASNPRAVIGHNGGPSDDSPDLLFIDARIVEMTLRYVQDVFAIDDLRVSGKAQSAKRAMGLRRAVVYCLDGLVPQESLGKCLGLHRDTIGDDQASVRRWVARDDEFAEYVEQLRLAVVGNIHVRIHREEFEGRLLHWVAKDPSLKRKANARASDVLAAKRKAVAGELAREEARALDARGRAQRLRELGYKDADAVEAEHMGPKALARRLSNEALSVVDAVHVAETKITPKKGERLRESALNAVGLEECRRYKLVRDGEPYLSRAPDRYVAPTLTCQSVYFEAVGLGRIKKRKKSEDDDDAEEDE